MNEQSEQVSQADKTGVDAAAITPDVLFDLGRADEAIAEAEKAIVLESDGRRKARYRDQLGDGLRRVGRAEDALTQYREAVRLDPTDSFFQAHVADVLFDLGRADEAIAEAEKIAGSAAQASYRDHLGDGLRRVGRAEDALTRYREAVKLDPANIDFASHVSRVLHLLGRFREAEGIQRRHIRDGGYRSYRSKASYADTLLSLGAQEAALARHRETVEKAMAEGSHPEVEAAARLLASRLVRRRRTDTAISCLNQLISMHNAFETDLRFVLALDVYYRTARFSDCIAQLELIRARPSAKSAYAYNQQGNCLLYAIGKAQDARGLLEEALSREPTNPYFMLDVAVALSSLGDCHQAMLLAERAALIPGAAAAARFQAGNIFLQQDLFTEAIQQYDMCPRDPSDSSYVSCRHNKAYALGCRGEYAQAREEWREVRGLYRDWLAAQSWDYWNPPDDRVLSDAAVAISAISGRLSDYDQAREFADRALMLDPTSVPALASAAQLYMILADEGLLARGTAFSRAREACNRAQQLLAELRVRSPGSVVTVDEGIELAEALIALEDLDAAKELLLEAEFHRPQQRGLHLALGVLYSGRGEYEVAIGHFRRAKVLGDGSLKAQSNLGEAYLKLGRRSEAEATYRAVLNQAPMHVEALLGMGEVLTLAGDAGGGDDSFPRAVERFTSAIEVSTSHTGSKTLTKKELASAYYSRGYARARQFETSKLRPDFGLLKDALSDFRKCAECAEDRLKPHQSGAKAEARLREYYRSRATETCAPTVLSILALLVFSLTQLSLWADKPHVEGLTLPYYVALTFTSLVLIIASISPPSLLRIKVAGIELEKKPVEQIGTGTPLGIAK